jgi:hypothetical protein
VLISWISRCAIIVIKMEESTEVSVIKNNEGLIHLIPFQPSSPKSFNQTFETPKPAIKVKIVAVAMAEENKPNVSGPISRATIV